MKWPQWSKNNMLHIVKTKFVWWYYNFYIPLISLWFLIQKSIPTRFYVTTYSVLVAELKMSSLLYRQNQVEMHLQTFWLAKGNVLYCSIFCLERLFSDPRTNYSMWHSPIVQIGTWFTKIASTSHLTNNHFFHSAVFCYCCCCFLQTTWSLFCFCNGESLFSS